MNSTISTMLLLSLLLVSSSMTDAFAPTSTGTATTTATTRTQQLFSSKFDTRGMWNNGNAFGKGDFRFYKSQADWMKPFPEEDKASFPELFTLPKGVYEVSTVKP